MSASVIAQPTEGKTFMARRFGLQLVKTPIRPIRNPSDGTIMDKTEGEKVEFKNGLFTAEKRDVADWLRKHPLFGNRDEGFWEMPQVAPEPSQAEYDAIIEATTAFDVDELRAIIAAEDGGWQREKLLAVARGALERVEAAIAKAQAEAA